MSIRDTVFRPAVRPRGGIDFVFGGLSDEDMDECRTHAIIAGVWIRGLRGAAGDMGDASIAVHGPHGVRMVAPFEIRFTKQFLLDLIRAALEEPQPPRPR